MSHADEAVAEDWNRFGKVRQTYEKLLRGPDDVFIQADEEMAVESEP